jgi:hypothetical protein
MMKIDKVYYSHFSNWDGATITIALRRSESAAVDYGMSLCQPEDQFCRSCGRMTAEERMIEAATGEQFLSDNSQGEFTLQGTLLLQDFTLDRLKPRELALNIVNMYHRLGLLPKVGCESFMPRHLYLHERGLS